jgi:hypothetical protein
MNKRKKIPKLIGRRELVDFPVLGLTGMDAKIDTGAYTSALHCTEIGERTEGEAKYLWFRLHGKNEQTEEPKEHRFTDYTRKKIKSSTGEPEERFVIKTPVKIGSRIINTTISLSDRASMRYPVLLGRRLLKRKFIVDVARIHTGGLALKSIFN